MCTSHRCWRSPCPRPDREVPGQPHSAKVPGVEQLERGALQGGRWCRNGGGVGQRISRRGLDITKVFNWVSVGVPGSHQMLHVAAVIHCHTISAGV
jgi:hypothetical protein